MKKNNINNVDSCTSCSACIDICPKGCIEMKNSVLGHEKAFASDLCIECAACLKVCPQIVFPKGKQPIKAVASWNPDLTQREKSSSGGTATVLSEHFIEDGGVVYGCKFFLPFGFKHVRCDTKTSLSALRGSKYVQSDMSGVYAQISQDLKKGKKVLFIGIPCQVAGVNNFFKAKNHNLYTIDLLCHGVASTTMLKKSLPKKMQYAQISNVTFRNNLFYQVGLWDMEKKIWERAANREWFLKGFLKDIFSKESCFSCKYACNQRMGDLTLGDFWGTFPKGIACDRSKGVNICVVNSTKGAELMLRSESVLRGVEVSLEDELNGNLQFNKHANKTWRRILFKVLNYILGYKIAETLVLFDVKLKNIIMK